MVWYTEGQKFDVHHDMGTLSHDGLSVDVVEPRRLVTLFVYLNDVPEANGGRTEFPYLPDASRGGGGAFGVQPKRGSAVVFSNVAEDGRADPRTAHRACPVTGGGQGGKVEKFGMNVWISDRSMQALAFSAEGVSLAKTATVAAVGGGGGGYAGAKRGRKPNPRPDGQDAAAAAPQVRMVPVSPAVGKECKKKFPGFGVCNGTITGGGAQAGWEVEWHDVGGEEVRGVLDDKECRKRMPRVAVEAPVEAAAAAAAAPAPAPVEGAAAAAPVEGAAAAAAAASTTLRPSNKRAAQPAAAQKSGSEGAATENENNDRQSATAGTTTTTAKKETKQWVQCEECSAWHVVPGSIDVDTLPEEWRCEMADWPATQTWATGGTKKCVPAGARAAAKKQRRR